VRYIHITDNHEDSIVLVDFTFYPNYRLPIPNWQDSAVDDSCDSRVVNDQVETSLSWANSHLAVEILCHHAV
jgi:hypothetical protein